MRSLLSVVVALAMLFLSPAMSSAQWSENFDSYASGSALAGQGGWIGWAGNPAWTSYVMSGTARSAPNADAHSGFADMVQQFGGVTSGAWVFSGWCYIPASIGGEQFFTLYNTYYPLNLSSRSVDLKLDLFNNLVRDNIDPGSPTLPLVRGQWVEIRIEFDFEVDWVKTYYNGTLLQEESWTAGIQSGGSLRLQALGLYAGGSPTIFWDDFDLREGGATAVQSSSWGRIKSFYH